MKRVLLLVVGLVIGATACGAGVEEGSAGGWPYTSSTVGTTTPTADGAFSPVVYVEVQVGGPDQRGYAVVPRDGVVTRVDVMAQCLSGGIADFSPGYYPPGVPAIDTSAGEEVGFEHFLLGGDGDLRADLDDELLPFGENIVGNNRVAQGGVLVVESDEDAPWCGSVVTFTVADE